MHQVSYQFLLIMVTFLRACHQARITSRVSPAFFQQFLESFRILPFSELMEQEPPHYLVLNNIACKVRLLSSSCGYIFSVFHREKLTLRRAVITLPVSDVFAKLLTKMIH